MLKFLKPQLLKTSPIKLVANRHYASGVSGLGRTNQDIAHRISCVHLMLSRWGIEAALKNGANNERIESAFNGISSAVDTTNVKDLLTSKERDLMIKPMGNWSQHDINQYSSMWESFGVLLWTLGLQESIPSYNHQFSRPDLFRSTNILPSQPQTISQFQLTDWPLRDSLLFHQQFTMCETWHWRGKAQNLLDLKNPPTDIITEEIQEARFEFDSLPNALKKMIEKLPEHIQLTAEKAKHDKLLDHVVDNDFGVDLGGIPEEGYGWVAFKHLDFHHQYAIMEIAKSRLFSFCWVMGSMEWDDDPADISTGSPIAKIWDAEQL